MRPHLWKPLLHEIATGVMDDGTDSLSYRAHGKNHHFSLSKVRSRASIVNRNMLNLPPFTGQEGDMLVVARRIPYDYLVIAIGSKSNDFNTKGVLITVFLRQLRSSTSLPTKNVGIIP